MSGAITCADAGRIGMFGESRGGMMTYRCLARVDWIKAAVTLAGAANLVRNAQLRPEMQRVFTEAFDGSLAAKQERSALFWPEALPDVPLLLMHGTADERVSPLDSIELAAKLLEHNKTVKLEIFEGGDHGLHTHKDEWRAQARGWFGRFL